VVLDKYTIIEAERSRVFYNWFQCFSPDDVEREFKDCGFAIERYYSDVAGTPFSSHNREFAVVAKKNSRYRTGNPVDGLQPPLIRRRSE